MCARKISPFREPLFKTSTRRTEHTSVLCLRVSHISEFSEVFESHLQALAEIETLARALNLTGIGHCWT